MFLSRLYDLVLGGNGIARPRQRGGQPNDQLGSTEPTGMYIRCVTWGQFAVRKDAPDMGADLELLGDTSALAPRMETTETPLAQSLAAPAEQRSAAQREFRQAVKYGIVGITNVVIDLSLYALLVSIGVWYPLAKTLSLVAATVNGYTLNRLWTFRAGQHRNIVLAKYVTVYAVCLAANVALLVLLIEVVGLGQIRAQVIVFPFIALCSFLGQRLWTFGYALR